MEGVRYGENGWEGLCPLLSGGCGCWLPLNIIRWDVLRTLKRCRKCEESRLVNRPNRRQEHAVRQYGYRRDPEKQEQYREYGRKYRARQKEMPPEIREARHGEGRMAHVCSTTKKVPASGGDPIATIGDVVTS